MQAEDKKITYLQMLQEPISRMSTASAIFKGFAATIVTGITAITFSEVHIIILALSFLPILSFAALDIYYLRIERKYRFIYEQVRRGNQKITFSLDINLSQPEVRLAKARIRDCIKSPSILLFYLPMLGILIVVFILKLNNII